MSCSEDMRWFYELVTEETRVCLWLDVEWKQKPDTGATDEGEMRRAKLEEVCLCLCCCRGKGAFAGILMHSFILGQGVCGAACSCMHALAACNDAGLWAVGAYDGRPVVVWHPRPAHVLWGIVENRAGAHETLVSGAGAFGSLSQEWQGWGAGPVGAAVYRHHAARAFVCMPNVREAYC